MDKPGISVVLPAYNEADNLPFLTAEISEHLQENGFDFEIIIVNDGSRDNTPSVLASLCASDSRIRPVIHDVNRGYGAALRSGFSTASKDYIFFMDSDRQFKISEINKLVSLAGSADIIAGYRHNRQDHLVRKLNAWIFNTAINVLFGIRVRDIDCAYKLFRRDILSRFPLEADGALINTEFLYKAKRNGFRIVQVPVSHYPRLKGSSTGANPGVIARAIKEVILFRFSGKLK